jgi:hypothetical protein
MATSDASYVAGDVVVAMPHDLPILDLNRAGFRRNQS